jgi:predicted Zn-dependent protease
MSTNGDGTNGVDIERLADKTLAVIGGRGEAEVLVGTTRAGLTRFANSTIHQHVGEETVTVRLRVAADGKVASGQTSRTDDEALEQFVEATLAAAAVQPVDPDWAGLAPPAPVVEAEPADPDVRDADPNVRTRQVAEFVNAGEGMRAAGFCDTEHEDVVFANSAGQQARGERARATIDGIHQTETSAGTGHQTSDRLADLDGAAVGDRAARIARASADATEIEPGQYEVVLRPECVATIAIFLGSYGFNAKHHLEDQSFARLGDKQFDDAFSLWDDATDPRAIGLPFDTEGTPKSRVDLIDAGTTTSLVHDRRTAAQAGVESTGHAVPGSETWGPYPLNLFIARGEATEEQLISQVERGILVTTFNYCRILDPKTQVVTGLTRNGTFLIENGEVTRPVSNLRFTQSFVDGMGPGRILGVTADTRFADSEFGAGFVVAPAMRLAEWNFTGGASG